jgi:hypothetical protein
MSTDQVTWVTAGANTSAGDGPLPAEDQAGDQASRDERRVASSGRRCRGTEDDRLCVT